uniref:Atrophin-1 n=1 Tax=Panagrellus redivivus TaxID=6233 RepID=A0A7E4W1C7_PANRE
MRNRPSAPPLSEYYYHEDHGSTASTSAGSSSSGDVSPYATITIPPPPGMRNPPGEINSGDIPGEIPGDMRGISPGTKFWVFLVLNSTVSYY